MAIALRSVQPQHLHPTITSGGLLWRRTPHGVEICLAHSRGTAGDFFSIPRGIVHEDERLADAALRRVFEQTGLSGRDPRQLGRMTFEDGEISYIHLVRAPRGSSRRTPAGAAWVPASSAPHLVETDGERDVLARVAALFLALEGPRSGRVVVAQPMAARRSVTSCAARRSSRARASAA